MGDIFAELQSEVFCILKHKVRCKYYTGSVSNAEWDDDQTFTKSGADVWYSGLILPIKNKFGSHESLLLQQGKLLHSDKAVYIQGSADLTAPSGGAIKFGVGSPVTVEHSMIPNGIESWPPTGSIVYHKLYARVLPTGSFEGEY